MALFASILLSVALASLPAKADVAKSPIAEVQTSNHATRVRSLIAVNGMGKSSKTAVEGFKQGLLKEAASKDKAVLTLQRAARFEAISTPICDRVLASLDDYAVQLIAPRLNSDEVEQLIAINTSTLGAKFISTMTSSQSFDHDKFDLLVKITADEIVAAMKEHRTYTVVSINYPPGSPSQTAKRVFDMTGNRRGVTAAVDDYFVHSIFKAIDADLPLSAMSEDEKLRLKPMIFVGKLSLANRMENHFVTHLAGHFSHDDLKALTDLYDTPVVLRASDAVMASNKPLADEIDRRFAAARSEFFAKYEAVD